MQRRKCVQVTVVALVFLINMGLSTVEWAPLCEPQTSTRSEFRLADTEPAPTPTPGTDGAGGGGHYGG